MSSKDNTDGPRYVGQISKACKVANLRGDLDRKKKVRESGTSFWGERCSKIKDWGGP